MHHVQDVLTLLLHRSMRSPGFFDLVVLLIVPMVSITTVWRHRLCFLIQPALMARAPPVFMACSQVSYLAGRPRTHMPRTLACGLLFISLGAFIFGSCYFGCWSQPTCYSVPDPSMRLVLMIICSAAASSGWNLQPGPQCWPLG